MIQNSVIGIGAKLLDMVVFFDGTVPPITVAKQLATPTPFFVP